MRLQLTAVAVALAVLAVWRAAWADGYASVDARGFVYQDSDRTTIVTSNVAARGEVGDRVSLDARYLVDMITSASVDVVSAATTAFHETRHEIEGGASYHDGTRTISASYVYSTENDWQSHTASLGFSHDFAHHDATISLGGSAVKNEVGRASDPNFHRELLEAGGAIGLTIVATPEDIFDLGYTFAYLHGYQASPYRYVDIVDAGGSPLGIAAPEADPENRTRHAVTLRYNHHMFRDTILRTHARAYFDDWGIASGTAGFEYVVGFGTVELGIFGRAYVQRGASFYRAVYDGRQLYMTADRELSPFLDGFGGGRLRLRSARLGPFRDVFAELKATAFAFKYFDFPRLPSRTGGMGQAGFGVTL